MSLRKVQRQYFMSNHVSKALTEASLSGEPSNMRFHIKTQSLWLPFIKSWPWAALERREEPRPKISHSFGKESPRKVFETNHFIRFAFKVKQKSKILFWGQYLKFEISFSCEQIYNPTSPTHRERLGLVVEDQREQFLCSGIPQPVYWLTIDMS